MGHPIHGRKNDLVDARICGYERSKPDFYNGYDIRDAFWKSTLGSFNNFARLPDSHGENRSRFRVGDVINPQDLSLNFGFANLDNPVFRSGWFTRFSICPNLRATL